MQRALFVATSHYDALLNLGNIEDQNVGTRVLHAVQELTRQECQGRPAKYSGSFDWH
jgi:hypothetical protein